MKTFFDFGSGLIGVIKKSLVVSLDFVGGRNIFFTTAWVSQMFIMTELDE
jgi:hypothetical protein